MDVTALAIEKLKEVMEEQGEQEGSLRVVAMPAETGGLQYMLTMENESQADDTVLSREGVRFLMDSDSAPFLGRGHHRLRGELRRPSRLRDQQPDVYQRRRRLRLRLWLRIRWLRMRQRRLRRPLGRQRTYSRRKKGLSLRGPLSFSITPEPMRMGFRSSTPPTPAPSP